MRCGLAFGRNAGEAAHLHEFRYRQSGGVHDVQADADSVHDRWTMPGIAPGALVRSAGGSGHSDGEELPARSIPRMRSGRSSPNSTMRTTRMTRRRWPRWPRRIWCDIHPGDTVGADAMADAFDAFFAIFPDTVNHDESGPGRCAAGGVPGHVDWHPGDCVQDVEPTGETAAWDGILMFHIACGKIDELWSRADQLAQLNTATPVLASPGPSIDEATPGVPELTDESRPGADGHLVHDVWTGDFAALATITTSSVITTGQSDRTPAGRMPNWRTCNRRSMAWRESPLTTTRSWSTGMLSPFTGRSRWVTIAGMD